jgi:hypothetical protein
MTAQFGWGVLCSQRMSSVEVACFGMASKAKTDGVVDRVRAAVSFLVNVVHIDVAPPKLMTNAATATGEN